MPLSTQKMTISKLIGSLILKGYFFPKENYQKRIQQNKKNTKILILHILEKPVKAILYEFNI